MTFYGQSTHQLDPKSRLCLPKRVHALVPEDAAGDRTIWLTRGRGGCIWLFTPAAFDERVLDLPNDPFGHDAAVSVEREFWASTFQTKLDGSNRVLVPDELREIAGIAPASEVCVIGMAKRVELWSAERRSQSRLATADYDRVAQIWAGASGKQTLASMQEMQAQSFQALLQQQQMEFIKQLGLLGIAPPGTKPPEPTPGEGGR